MLSGLYEIVLGALGALLGIFLLAKVGIPLVRAMFWGTTTQATVLKVELTMRTRKREIPVLKFSFTTRDGRRVEITKDCPNAPGAKAGESISVRYDPAFPETTVIVGDANRQLVGLTILLAFALVGAGVVLLGVHTLHMSGH